MHVSHSLRKTLRKESFLVTIDRAFARVLDGCAAPRPGDSGTWLSPPMRRAYAALHRAGLAHSIEVWMDGELAGGIYGVAIGRMFFGESMFSRRTDASKIAMVRLAAQLDRWEFPADRLPARNRSPAVARRRAAAAAGVRRRGRRA